MEHDVEEVNLVRTTRDAVQWLMEVTNCSETMATRLLELAGGDIAGALDLQSTIAGDPSLQQAVASDNPEAEVLADDTDTENGEAHAEEDSNSREKVVLERIVRVTGASLERAGAALRMAGGDEQAAVEVINSALRRQMINENGKRRREDGTSEPQTPIKARPKDVVILCWNIDGLCDRGLTDRFSGVISQIKTSKPHVVLLQEVVAEHVERLRESFGRSYHLVFGDMDSAYFNTIMVSKEAGRLIDTSVMQFPTSLMGRHLIKVTCEILGQSLTILTSHLESMKDHSAERINQLRKVIEQMCSVDRDHVVLFGGDTNLRDVELQRIKTWGDVYDVWEKLGSDLDNCYTWDTGVNKNTQARFRSRQRFDRIYLRESTKFKPKSFKLVGTETLVSCRMFPSDHWGLLATFTLSP